MRSTSTRNSSNNPTHSRTSRAQQIALRFPTIRTTPRQSRECRRRKDLNNFQTVLPGTPNTSLKIRRLCKSLSRASRTRRTRKSRCSLAPRAPLPFPRSWDWKLRTPRTRQFRTTLGRRASACRRSWRTQSTLPEASRPKTSRASTRSPRALSGKLGRPGTRLQQRRRAPTRSRAGKSARRRRSSCSRAALSGSAQNRQIRKNKRTKSREVASRAEEPRNRLERRIPSPQPKKRLSRTSSPPCRARPRGSSSGRRSGPRRPKTLKILKMHRMRGSRRMRSPDSPPKPRRNPASTSPDSYGCAWACRLPRQRRSRHLGRFPTLGWRGCSSRRSRSPEQIRNVSFSLLR